ncbi:MAG TPA: hypothetical protein VED01_07835 [Burkholderiales bacterium]|nr:hypothetical protein [Burkholderiales bacterium]
MCPELYGVAIGELAAIARVDRSTASRWKRGLARLPFAVLALVRLRCFGELELALGPDWHGWTIGRDGRIYPPGYRVGFTPGEILAMPYLYGQIAALERRVREIARERRLNVHHSRLRCARRARQ